jgi:pilus assembly protein CpaB
MGRWKALIPIGLALIIAIVGSVLIYNWMKQQAVPERITEEIRRERPATIQVAVAAVDIGAGERLTGEMVQTAEFIQVQSAPGLFH